MSGSNNVGARRFRGSPLAVRVPLALALAFVVGPVATFLATSPASASAAIAQDQPLAPAATSSALAVNGAIPYRPDASADVTTPPNTSCSTLRKLEALVEGKLAEHTVFPSDAASLFQHWLDGTGTGVSLGQTSALARELLTYPGFVGMNSKVQVYAAQRFNQGQANVTLPTPTSPLSQSTDSSPLTLLNFSSEGRYPDLYWAFRGTQGLRVSGSVTKDGGRYSGKLTYTIYDTYGFPASSTGSISGRVTASMNYLQTHCGWPKYASPRWFSDSLTVTVPFNQPAAS
jgi:hypothetical protein